MDPVARKHDVIIMGGGLAGLTLAIQLRQRFDDIDVLVIERRAHPVPHAAHKVGESSVEIGAHYFDTVLGLKEHMQTKQLRKFGFRFFNSEGKRDLDQVTEIGARRFLRVPSYQIDRGIFENFLAEEAVRLGASVVDDAMVRQIDLAGDAANAGGSSGVRDSQPLHRVTWTQGEATHTAEARWIVDACGRAGLIKRKLGLAEANAHDVNAAWFRIGEHIDVDQWVDNKDWRALCNPQSRWLSTNHMCGTGYWTWLIPLASGSHSVGIVADPKLHPLETYNTFEKAMDWLQKWQPSVFDKLDGKRHLLQDFLFLRHFSHGCKQVFSGQRWALTGDAGLFLDPFYSPGSDFIAMSNCYITDLIAHDRAGESIEARAQLYDQLYHSFYESTLALYQDQYPIFGDPEVLPVKVIWDYTYYWAVLAQIFFHNRLTDLAMLGSVKEELQHCQKLNIAMQNFLRAWSERTTKRNPAVMLDHAGLPWFVDLNSSLYDTLDDAAFRQRLRDGTDLLRRLATEIYDRSEAHRPEPEGMLLRALVDQKMTTAPAAAAQGTLLFEALQH
ncbi:MAG: NAD(P)/FAD-dependent oxidoreductase [Variovorax sp.]|nr:MAG: NAD(P)/FAD-dependent oxidoreductase [Variovorax sp.]